MDIEAEARKVARILSRRDGPCVVCGGRAADLTDGPPNHSSFNCPAARLMLLTDAVTIEGLLDG